MSRLQRSVLTVFVASRSVRGLAQTLANAVGSSDHFKDTVVEEVIIKNGDKLVFQDGSPEESDAKLRDIEVFLGDSPFISQILSLPDNKLKWATSTFAGVDLFMKERERFKMQPGFVCTRTTTQFGQFMSEYVIGEIIARERRFTQMDDLQRNKVFDQLAVKDYRTLDELTVGILGLGNIGSEIARLCSAFNMTVWAAVRDEKANREYENVHRVWPMSSLSEFLAQCDYIVSVLPGTPETTGLLGGDVLQVCHKKKSVLVNIGRGSIIDDDSLVNAIRNGWLGGAILDVFNNEPLPSTSPLWSLPGVTITPHVSGVTTAKNCVAGFLQNLALYRRGETLKNIVDFEKGY